MRRAPEHALRALSDGALSGRIEGFELGEELGHGAMGSVLRARDRLLGRSVAVKVLAGGSEGQGLRRRFVVEAQLGAQLEHPNIVPFYELLATPDGQPAFAMKLVDGQTLESHIWDCSRSAAVAKRAPYDLATRLDRFLKVCDAVDYAHARGVVHRDLKPGNVMLGAHNEVYVMDWGVARVLADAPNGGEDVKRPKLRERGLTEDGEVVGTPHYMAPEQARAEPVTEAADQYSLGMMLAELVTLSPPRSGSVSQELADAMLARPPRLEPRFDGPLPRELVAIVRKATAPQPAQRYASVAELAEDVRRFLRDEPVSVLRDPTWVRVWRRLKRRPAIVFGTLAVSLLLASGALLLWLTRELGARERAAARAERIFALSAAVDRTARNVDAHLRRVELLLEGLARAAAEVSRAPAQATLEAMTPADIEQRLNPARVERYGQRVSFERSAFVRSPNVDPAAIAPVLARLDAFEALLVGTAARAAAGDEATGYDARRQREVARERGSVLWSDLAFESGVLLVYPGNTFFPAGYEVRERGWYASARSAFGHVWGSPYPDATSGALIIACSRAFSSGSEGLAGVAALHMRLEDVLGEITVPQVEGYRGSSLLDESGNVVLSEQTRELELAAGLHQNRTLERRPFEVEEVRAAIARGDREGRVQSGSRLTVFQSLDTARWLLAVSVDSEPYVGR